MPHRPPMTSEEARAAACKAVADGAEPSLRSCWNCNAAHERLKEVEYPILCPWCGKWYFLGVEITEVQL